MSQTMDRFGADVVEGQSHEFQYRPVPVLAPVSVVVGLSSIISLASVVGLALAVIGIVLGAVGYWRIRQSAGEFGGKAVAAIGFCLSVFFLISGSSLHAYNFVTELPEGHIRVNFPADISKKQFVMEAGRRKLHPDVLPLVGQDVFIKGYMWNNRTGSGLTGFVMLKDNGKCCFGGDPALYDMMVVRMQDEQTVDYMEGLISVAGKLQADPDAGPEDPVYVLEATMVERARSRF